MHRLSSLIGIIGNSNGISHGDMADYRRALVTGIDIPEVYANMVEDLKKQGF